MTPEELETEDREMRQWFRQVKTGSKLITIAFAFLMAVGGMYLMLRSIINK